MIDTTPLHAVFRSEARRVVPNLRDDAFQEAVLAVLSSNDGQSMSYYRQVGIGAIRDFAAKERRESGLRAHNGNSRKWSGATVKAAPDIFDLTTCFAEVE